MEGRIRGVGSCSRSSSLGLDLSSLKPRTVPNYFFTISLDVWNRYYLVVALKSMGTTAGRSPESRAPVPCDNVKVAGKFLDVINVQSLKTYLEF